MDPEALSRRNTVIAKIMAQYAEGQPNTVLPVVSLEDFFEANWDEHSLVPNKADYGRPPLRECYRILREIRDRPDVQDVLVTIHESPDADEEADVDIWPDSDAVYVLTSATAAEVTAWVAPLFPDSIGDTWSCRTGVKPNAAPDLWSGMKVRAIWWD